MTPIAFPSVYIAAPYPLRDRAQQLRTEIEFAGFPVTSTWIRQPDTLSDEFARVDLADVSRACVLVAYNPPEYKNAGTGGRHVELGYALALGKPVVLIGEPSNIFHYLSTVQVCADSLAEILTALRATVPAVNSARQQFIIVQEVARELQRAELKHPPMHSPHEGYAVIREEVDELWDHVKVDTGRTPDARHEAIQIAAMGARYALNLTESR